MVLWLQHYDKNLFHCRLLILDNPYYYTGNTDGNQDNTLQIMRNVDVSSEDGHSDAQ